MTDQNNAAQPVLTEGQIRTLILEKIGNVTRALREDATEFARAIESALLSKLRAHGAENQESQVGSRHPVVVKWRNNGIEACAGIADAYGMNQAAADMRAMLTKEKGNESSVSLGGCPSSNRPCDERSVDRSVRDGSVFGVTHLENALREMIEVAERVDGWQSFPIDPIERARAALASAPVAGEAKTYPGDNVAERLDKMADDQPSGSQAQSDLYAAATIWRKHIAHRAAPQASEAVRQQSAGDVVAVLVYKSKGRPGAHGQTLGANGAGEFAVLYRGDEFAALVKANEEIRALEAAGHRLDFAAIIHGEGYSGPMLRQEYVTRAALSAQPAQKEQHTDGGAVYE